MLHPEGQRGEHQDLWGGRDGRREDKRRGDRR
jgi:hypothetical protein